MSIDAAITVATPSAAKRPLGSRISAAPLLWKMLGIALLIHIILLIVLSPRLFSSGGNSPEQNYQRGETLLKDGKYVEAMEAFQQVMDVQPKPPPIYERAAEQHRTAERLARQAASRPVGEHAVAAATGAPANPATKPAAPPTTHPATKPKPVPPDNFVPPELRTK